MRAWFKVLLVKNGRGYTSLHCPILDVVHFLFESNAADSTSYQRQNISIKKREKRKKGEKRNSTEEKNCCEHGLISKNYLKSQAEKYKLCISCNLC